jgi:hypothetical protein
MPAVIPLHRPSDFAAIALLRRKTALRRADHEISIEFRFSVDWFARWIDSPPNESDVLIRQRGASGKGARRRISDRFCSGSITSRDYNQSKVTIESIRCPEFRTVELMAPGDRCRDEVILIASATTSIKFLLANANGPSPDNKRNRMDSGTSARAISNVTTTSCRAGHEEE